MIDLNKLKREAEKEIGLAKEIKDLDGIYKKYLGKKGEVSLILKRIKEIPVGKRKSVGLEVNAFKRSLKAAIEKAVARLSAVSSPAAEAKAIDVSVPGKKPLVGHLHPLTQVKREAMSIFQTMGFEVLEGPEVETEWYNFDALNIPKDHPARDAWDTFWLKTEGEKLLLRTHTSPVQARYMEKHQPPLRVIAPGKAFRYEATDASHEFQFYQIEGLMVDKDTSAGHLKAVIREFFERFFSKEFKLRLRPDYFPFTEPSFEVAMSCLVCGGRGCPVCKNSGWLEMAGAGMVHPNVFKNCGLNPKQWQGWAFGFGWDRLAMMKYKINDIRLFNSGDLRFLEQF
jgi:phenylalanyl-tRNA synthetase alpha chain